MSERTFEIDRIPFAETREYVGRVLDARASYRDKYSHELGL
jgi:soluble lytic murein transglycosylase-like protein